MTDEAVLRLYRAIVERLDEASDPVTVADLCDRIVPYAVARSAIGVELKADYEHALLRLLAGERGLLRIEPESARRELQEEARSPYPSVGVFRRFAGCRVRVRWPDEPWAAAHIPDRADSDPEPPPEAPFPPTETVTEPPPPPSPTPRRAPSTACPYCEQPLPADRSVRFCPRCGADQQTRPCAQCGAILQQDWRYCVQCGQQVGD